MYLNPFRRHKYESIEDAVTHARHCTSVYVYPCNRDIAGWGEEFLKLQALRELYLQADNAIFYDYSIVLPAEIGKLHKLKKLTLLNFPLTSFPEWIMDLRDLEYLMVRGNDITEIPKDITRLNKLRRLRIENCKLATLPAELSEMHHLKHLGLCDTRLADINVSMFPPKLKSINFAGTGCYRITDLQQLQLQLPNTRIIPNLTGSL